MATSSSPSNPNPQTTNPSFPSPLPTGFDPNSSHNTTFVQADPSNFRAVVQRLTGAAAKDPSAQKLPITGKPISSGEMGPRRPAFKLHERRQTARKLEIKLNSTANGVINSIGSPSSTHRQRSLLGLNYEMVMVSPVSTLDFLTRGGSPRTPMSPFEEEEKAIAEKGFYFHPSPLTTPRGSEPPELLPLFPLHSPTNHSSSSNP